MHENYPFEVKYLPIESDEEPPELDSWKVTDNWKNIGDSMFKNLYPLM